MKLIRNYIFWAYERGSFHYDVMVTLILIFVFVTPRFVDFGDKPVPVAPHASDVLVKQAVTNAGHTRILYEIRAENLAGVTTDPALRAAIISVIQPLSGDVTLEQYHPVTDDKGKVIAYDATVLR
jgi:hypothetical protein